MGDITKNFSRDEVECPDCSLCEIDFGIVHRLQTIRDTACWVAQRDTSIVITSGCRCRIHNRRVGGKPSSRHLRGSDRESYRTPFDVSDALDWSFLNEKDKWLLEVIDIVFRDTFCGGWHWYKDKGFVHMDLRPGEKGRW